jgi:hypothetical protein
MSLTMMSSMAITYEISTDAFGHQFIRCLLCGLASYHPEDIQQKYCGYCHVFHDDLKS